MNLSRARSLIGISLGLVLLLSPLSLAQERGGGRAGGRQPRVGMGGRGFGGFTMDKSALLRSEQVQTEIKITEEQLAKVQEAVAAQREAARADASGRERPNFREMSEEERAKYTEEMRKRRAKQSAEMDKKLGEILKKEQMTRLGQIHFQQMGVQALKNEKIAKQLKITEEQTKKIDEVIAWGGEERQKLYEGIRELSQEERRTAFAEMREKTVKLQEQVKTKALACLTEEQQKKCKKMSGKEFKLDMQSFRGGRGGRGNREGGAEGGRRSRGEGEGGGERRRPQAEDSSTI